MSTARTRAPIPASRMRRRLDRPLCSFTTTSGVARPALSSSVTRVSYRRSRASFTSSDALSPQATSPSTSSTSAAVSPISWRDATSAFPPSRYATARRTRSVGTARMSFGRPLREQLEDRIARGDGCEALDRRACRDREVAPHGRLEAIQVGLQHRGLLLVGEGPQPALLAPHAPAQRDLPAGARVPDPLRLPASRDQEASAAVLEHVHRRRVGPPAPPPAHLEQVVVGEAKSQAHEEPERPVEQALDGGRRCEAGR